MEIMNIFVLTKLNKNNTTPKLLLFYLCKKKKKNETHYSIMEYFV